jgi:hypothetical protein
MAARVAAMAPASATSIKRGFSLTTCALWRGEEGVLLVEFVGRADQDDGGPDLDEHRRGAGKRGHAMEIPCGGGEAGGGRIGETDGGDAGMAS